MSLLLSGPMMKLPTGGGGGGGIPDITAYNEGEGYSGGTFSASFGATNATDQIFLIVGADGDKTATAPNFTQIGTIISSGPRTTILKWNGGGTRPNSSSVTVTLSAASNYTYQTFVVNGTATSSVTTNTTSLGTSHSGSTITSSGNALLFHVVALQALITTITVNTPSGFSTEPAQPATNGYWDMKRSTTAWCFTITEEQASSGTTTAANITTTYNSAAFAVFEVT